MHATTKATMRRALLALAGVAILVGVAIPNLNANATRINNSNNPAAAGFDRFDLREESRRQLQVDLAEFNDPKTETVKSDAADSPSFHKFAYGFADPVDDNADCVHPEVVEGMARTLRDLYERHGVRVFPRNGLLLGLIRHGGYLPNEIPDDDLGIVPSDLEKLLAVPGTKERNEMIRVGDRGEFLFSRKKVEDNWASWFGMNPARPDEEYPYFGVRITWRPKWARGRIMWAGRANSVYPYEKRPGTYFYPELNLKGYNGESRMAENFRWNSEGADRVLLDADEPLTEESDWEGRQIGTIFDTDLECMTLTQFYFTHIYVPCDSEKILKACYGNDWNVVESREGGKGNKVAMKLSEEEMAEMKARGNGPKPLCAASMEQSPWQ
eukprot:CAMPEP_0172529810 /NCGR_PEP_ID=MMETSP1067-20121228/3789_1 /TAXON_ID=265564 ORGANISM="Thalassiosira punctigera, Strain Tpunct2005C2" /NCGR_SAMPLE_ID=MMETSP1067 /ASSEMBLY_ACC=CAM_ASM_000444 /LENGTH=382 /DNA_ID=CAMNT_0013313935 /DNA_START=79 /DNA_END=1227 /DNA_ORIENTATION=+